jgi:alpha-tubulin suppressor-like RCC1 family protein
MMVASGRAPVAVSGVSDFVQIAAGGEYTCSFRRSGGFACWGFNGNGELGDGTMTNRAVPTAVVGLP